MPSPFEKNLTRYLHRRRLGIWATWLPLLLAALLLLALAFGFGDLFYAWSETARAWTRAILIILLAAALLWTALRALHFKNSAAARLADQAANSPRRAASAAATLPDEETDTPFSRHLKSRTRTESATALATLGTRGAFPKKQIALAFATLALAALALGLAWRANPAAAHTVFQRFLTPHAETAPWSPLKFHLQPSQLSVIYGDDLSVTSSITGGEPEDEVFFLVRPANSKTEQSLRALRDPQGKFVRTLPSVTEPLEVAFATGRARSAWHSVSVIYQPRVSAAELTTTPPPYLNLPPLTVDLTGERVSALAGSEVELTIHSNRPLSGGTLTLTPVGDRSDRQPLVVQGTATESGAALFRWTAGFSGEISAEIRDIRQTAGESPFQIAFAIDPDAAPAVTLEAAGQTVLATPDSSVKFEGRAEDDHQLATIRLVRNLVGFRDRAETLAENLPTKDFSYTDRLDLGKLGVSVGQTLEFFLEASDRNPSLLGVGASDVVRVGIISEEEYARRIREQTTLAQFMARYREANRVLDEADQALQNLAQAAAANDPQALQKATAEAAAKHAQAVDLMEKLAADFTAYDSEDRLAESAAKASETLKKNIAELATLDQKTPEEIAAAAEKMRDALGRGAAPLLENVREARQINEVGKIMEMAATYRRLYQIQKSVADRFLTVATEVARGQVTNTEQLRGLSDTQERNLESLNTFATELKKRAEALPASQDPLRQSVLAFLAEMEAANIASPMETAANAGRAGKSSDAAANSELAKLQMEQLMKQNQASAEAQGQGPSFGGMCQGNTNGLGPGAGQTMAQLMEGMMARALRGIGRGGIGGSGQGFGGSGEDGSAMSGIDANIPVIGPDRLNFSDQNRTGLAQNNKPGDPSRLPDQAAKTSALNAETLRASLGDAPEATAVPEKYRESVKRFFSISTETSPTSETP